MSSSQYVGLALVVLLASAGVHWLVWDRVLAVSLRSAEPAVRAAALRRWLKAIVAVQLIGFVLAAAWVIGLRATNPHGLAWLAPVIGLVAGNALPLQVAVFGISRAARQR